ncbi:nonribosomal peptide synthetase 12 [Aspergillus udagawae]|uniref:Nonribosomal peptide synthetase 12 n=1 Tax=Aspergillus udagawae TaxID=91492 RepID=A0A8H3XKJ8_9EURO|nr:nonribosomal peptide synthetase 12 [Aspergillus udagawae]
MTEENLDLVGGEEATWTRMLAVSEAQVIWTRTNQLCNAFVTGSLPHVVEPIAVPAWLTTPSSTKPIFARLNIALAPTISNMLDCRDVILELFSNGRQVYLPGIEDLLAPTLAAYPLRIRVNPQERVLELVCRIQEDSGSITTCDQFQVENMARISPSLHEICKSAIRLDILPFLEPTKANYVSLFSGGNPRFLNR